MGNEVTVKNAWTQRGWSATDHLINDSSLCLACEGKIYATVKDAIRAVEERTDPLGYPMFDFVYTDNTDAPIRMYRYDGAPAGIPGRDLQRISRI